MSSIKIPKRKIMTTAIDNDNESAKRPCVDEATIALAKDVQDSYQKEVTAANPFIPPPTLKNTINVRLDESLAVNGRIVNIQVQNYVGNSGQKSCRLRTLTKDNERVWTSTILTQINSLIANENWTVLASHSGELFCYATMSGSVLFSLRLDYPILKVMLNKNFCGVQNTNDQISVWDFEKKKRLATYKLTPLIARNSDKISNYLLSNTGVPVIFMKNGDLWYYSRRQSAWQQVQTGIDLFTSFLTHLEFIQKVITNGLISKIIINKKQLKSAVLSSALVAENIEEEQMEFLLSALDEMHYPEEYLLLASIYIQRLASRGKTRRLYAYIQSLEHIPNDSMINKSLIHDEIEDVLSKFPLIQKEIEDLPSKLNDEVNEDLGFL